MEEYNDEILERYCNSAISKRLKRELKLMYLLYAQIDVSITSDKNILISIYDIIDNRLCKYNFIIPKFYPFTCPVIYYQDRPYIEFLKMTDYELNNRTIFKKLTGHNCYCCNSFNCDDNWSASITLIKIIDEIRTINKCKRNIIYNLFANKIKQKYLISDIDLESWLY